MILNVVNETNKLKKVVLGIAHNLGEVPLPGDCIDPKTKHYLNNGEYPLENNCITEIENFNNILIDNGVSVMRPKPITDLNQIFTRDIAFVIDNIIFEANTIAARAEEKNGILDILNKEKEINKIQIPKGIKIEGGDVIINNNFIFIGCCNKKDENLKVSRTNKKAVDFIKEVFPNKDVIGFELVKNDNDPYNNILHLDCTMQPVGKNDIIIYEGGFRNKSDYSFINEIFRNNMIKVTSQDMFNGFPNIFSINNKKVVSDITFHKLNSILEERGYTVEKTMYREISKFGGLFRCSTLPLERK
tara:strand:- start:6059 stop:6964 length:906 start_codon:yes stop_codon:yes gene_type:complete